MPDRILVPYDDSAPSEAALEFAIETFPDAELTALYVVPIPEGIASAYWERETPPITGRAEAYAEAVLEEARAVAERRGRELDAEVRVGRPDRRIVALAEDGDFDAIVVGSHGREGPPAPLLGSVAERVVRRAPVPVVVVR